MKSELKGDYNVGYAKLLMIIFLGSIAINTAYAQEQPNTFVTTLHPNASRFNPTDLRQLFNINYGAFGSVRLSTIIHGAEFPQGNAYGLITAVPSENKILINGHYDISHDDISISMRGDIVVKKAISPELYPRIALNSGAIRINGMIIQCTRPDCRYININSETGWMKISGKADIFGKGTTAASLTGREELITTVTEEDLRNEQIVTAYTHAKNINIKAKQTPEDVLVGLILKTEPTRDPVSNEDRPQIGRFTLIEANNAGYIILENQKYEELSGDAKIFSIISPEDEEDLEFSEAYPMLVHNGRNDVILYASQNNLQQAELFRLKSGDINYGIREGVNYEIGRLCSERTVSCIYFYQDGKAELKLTKRPRRSPFIGLMSLDSGWISSIDIKPFEIADGESKLIVKKPSLLGTRSIIFSRDEIIVDGNWEDFGISFSGYTFDNIENRHHKLECRINERQCYLDQRPITSINQRSQRCNADEDCGEGICRSNRCVEARSCTRIVGNGDPTNIDLVIAGENFGSIEEVQEIAVGLDRRSGLIYGPSGLFDTEPFSWHRAKFNIWIQTAPAARVEGPASRAIPGEFGIDLECPEANIQIIVSRRGFRSHASFAIERCMVSLADPRNINKLFMHEFGHCFGHLTDEYYEFQENSPGNPLQPNCIMPEQGRGVLETALEEWSRLICNGRRVCDEATIIVDQEARGGCGGPCDKRCRAYLRPSENSIMNDHEISDSFNTISRAWLEKKIRRWG